MRCLVCVAVERTETLSTALAGLPARDGWGAAACTMVYALARDAARGQRLAPCEHHARMIRMLDEPGGPFRAKDGTERAL